MARLVHRAPLAAVAAVALIAAACGPTPSPGPARAPTPPSTTTSTTRPAETPKPIGPSLPVAPPTEQRVVAAITCPVVGAHYTDDYGPRGSGFHAGIDMLVPMRTPVRAVLPGRVHQQPNDGVGGNTAYLTADDGNVYMTVHLDDFVGGDRRVGAGAVIGHAGMTGNATTPQVHFEIRLGGPNGKRIDPFPTLRAAGC
jgi:murein DD-endopeptidase MepM/ murein hydrolase activator NlpD